MMIIKQYQRKPLIVEAVQVNANNLYEVAAWCEGDVATQQPSGKRFVKVKVIGREPSVMWASPGMWVVKSAQGYKVFSNNAFLKSWDEIGVLGEALMKAISESDPPAGEADTPKIDSSDGRSLLRVRSAECG